jgi:multiple sugar transport system ATP-binding protein
LRAIAGLEPIDAGRVHIGDMDVTNRKARDRDIAMVFQNYALYPQMSVRKNLEFGLKTRKIGAAERRDRIAEVASVLGLEPFLERRPGELSGGQRQRVAMGRAIVRRPAAFLMDEPLSNLDAKLRVSMRTELARMSDRLGVTTVYVTHDQVEAMTLGHRVAVMRDGVIQQCDTPRQLFDHPRNLFVAAFIGSPVMNLALAEVTAEEVSFAGWRIKHSCVDVVPPGQVVVGIRPTDFKLDADAPTSWPRLDVEVSSVEELGSERVVMFTVEAPPIDVDVAKTALEASEGDSPGLFSDSERSVFSARIAGRGTVTAGDDLCIAVDPNAMHFFDHSTGESLAKT